MLVADLVNFNIDLLLVGVAIAGIALLGFLVFFNNANGHTNRAFLFFALLTVFWGASNYFEYKFETITATLWAMRVHLFLSVWHAFAFFTFSFVFPEQKIRLPNWYYLALIPMVIFTSLLTLTPLVFSGIPQLAAPGHVTNPDRGPGIAFFSLVAFGLLFSGLGILFRKWWRAGQESRHQNRLVFIGMALTAVSILAFNVFLPVVLHTLTFIPLAALFILPVIGAIAYAVMRYHLFNAKVATAQIFSFLLTLATLVQVLFSASVLELTFRTIVFLVVLAVAILFVRSVTNEVRQRETIEVQEKELEVVNAQQVTLLHFISHEIKGYLTKGQNAFAGIIEGDYGPPPQPILSLSENALKEMRKGVATVMDILEASNLKKGTVSYSKAVFDFKQTVKSLVDDLRPAAEQKKLELTFEAATGDSYSFLGDEEKIKRHVIRNLIDNSIRYTLSGSVHVSLSGGANIRFTVQDTGVGISSEDMQKLFTEGGHGKDSLKVNVDSTGYGLYIAKQIVEAHGGKIWAESEGAGKGSRFIADFPQQQDHS
ncbi:MAG: hypothetical protein RIQ56_599 [Candidatus Parcubacteria bacterium]